VGAIGFLDVRDQLFNKHIFTKTIGDLRIIVPAHGATVRKDIDSRVNVSGFDRCVDLGSQLIGLRFRAGAPSMKTKAYGKGTIRLLLANFGAIDEVTDIKIH